MKGTQGHPFTIVLLLLRREFRVRLGALASAPVAAAVVPDMGA